MSTSVYWRFNFYPYFIRRGKQRHGDLPRWISHSASADVLAWIWRLSEIPRLILIAKYLLKFIIRESQRRLVRELVVWGCFEVRESRSHTIFPSDCEQGPWTIKFFALLCHALHLCAMLYIFVQLWESTWANEYWSQQLRLHCRHLSKQEANVFYTAPESNVKLFSLHNLQIHRKQLSQGGREKKSIQAVKLTSEAEWVLGHGSIIVCCLISSRIRGARSVQCAIRQCSRRLPDLVR